MLISRRRLPPVSRLQPVMNHIRFTSRTRELNQITAHVVQMCAYLDDRDIEIVALQQFDSLAVTEGGGHCRDAT